MPGLFLVTPGTYLSLESEHLRIDIPSNNHEDENTAGEDTEVRYLPLIDIEHVVIDDHTNITIPALVELMRRNIPVILTSRGERVMGVCIPPENNNRIRLLQYQKFQCVDLCLSVAKTLIQAKIANSRRVLQRLSANRTEHNVQSILSELDDLIRKVSQAETLETLRGYEGASAGKYFEAYSTFFPPECPFEYRSRQPPHNAVNAIMSFAYTIMTSEMHCHIYAHGLDPAIGFYHEPVDGRPSLSLDLIEPFRAPLADAMALDMITHKILKTEEHFEQRNGGVYLNMTGRKRFFVNYERRMNREFVSEYYGRRTTIRNELQNQVKSIKKLLTDGTKFQPFLMN